MTKATSAGGPPAPADTPAEAALRAFVLAYANVEGHSEDMIQAALFRAWLQGVAALGMVAPPIDRGAASGATKS